MSTHLLLEAAVRAVIMGAIILVALRLMRIEQVRAQRTAWLLALVGALAMPFVVAAHIGPRLLPESALFSIAQPEPMRTVFMDYRGPFADSRGGTKQDVTALDQRTPATQNNSDDGQLTNPVLSLAVFGYCVVAAVLSLRLCAGVGFALRLRNQAARVIFPFDPELDVRTSARFSTPVTIGLSVLLPSNYTSWDGAILRIVLSHERAHVRQRDFYVHALAGLHCALFWFNPFSWWLQRRLSELGEALSDCAAVGQAESRASYAEILLAFATRTHWPLTGVAMASASNLTPRIERLLSDQGFERSFARKQRLPFIAAGVVALAMFASTSLVRVHASPTSGPINVNNFAADASTPNTPTAPEIPPAPDTPPAPIAPAAPAASPKAPASINGTSDTRPSQKAARVRKSSHNDFDSDADAGDENTLVEHDDAYTNEEGVLAIHSGHSHIMFNTDKRLPSQGGDFIYFQHDGKPYLVQDPQIIATAQALLEPMRALGDQQKTLGDQQKLLRVQQRMLISQQRAVKFVETPEFKHEMAELQRTIKELDLPRLTVQIDPRALAEIQAHLGEIQARVGELQTELGNQQGKVGEEQGKLGEEQGKLGEQQALLGEQQRKIVDDVRRQLKPIIEQAIREGKVRRLSTD